MREFEGADLDPHDPLLQRAILKEQAKRAQRGKVRLFDRSEQEIPQHQLEEIYSKCHAKQREMLESRERFKLVCCPRRTGKSFYNILECWIHALRFPNSMIAYIVPDSRAHAKDLFWLPAKQLNEKMGLGWVFKEVEKRVITPNGTNIIILGAHDKESPQRLRGNPYSLVLLDECKDFGPHFEELVVEAVLPGLGDYQGTLVLAGTPGHRFEGLFYRISTSQPEGWKVARWIKSDNTFLHEKERDLNHVWEEGYKPFGLTRDSPRFRREQLAEWVREDSERAYHFHPVRNFWNGELTASKTWQFLCGIDIGKRDQTVIQPAAFSYEDLNLYYLEPFAQRGMYIEQLYDEWAKLNRTYNFVGTVVDTGGLGVMIVDSINMRHGCNWEAAKKGPGYKLGAVEQMNSDFLLGRIKAEPDSKIARAWSRSIVDPKTSLPTHSDECDAALYLHRFSYHWQGANPVAPPKPGSPDWWNKQESEAIENAVKKRNHRAQGGTRAISDG